MKILKIEKTEVVSQYNQPKHTIETSLGNYDFWGVPPFQEGNILEEDSYTIVSNKNPRYNSTLKVNKPSGMANFASKSAPIEKAMKDKATNIQVAQDRANTNMTEAANWRDAVMIVNTLVDKDMLVNGSKLLEPSEYEKIIRNKINNWKAWFAEQKEPGSQPPF